MIRKLAIAAVGLMMGVLPCAAQAGRHGGSSVSIGIGIGISGGYGGYGGYGYYGPRYYAPTYYAPRYYCPPPVYYSPPVYYAPPVYYSPPTIIYESPRVYYRDGCNDGYYYRSESRYYYNR